MKPGVAIIGAGITGLTAAYTLLKQGFEVSIFEARPTLGGLSAQYNFGEFSWDRFYHCILTSDESLLQLIDELQLTPLLRWRTTAVGLYSHDMLYPMSTPLDLLRFPGLSLASKIRFGLGVMYAGYICRGRDLEHVPLKDWVIRIFGQTVHREMWDPLLRCKLGEMRSEASASFLWSTIRRLYSTRSKGLEKREQLGYIEGGYHVLFKRLVQEIQNLGGRLYIGTQLDCIEPTHEGVGVSGTGAFREFDACLLTIPAPDVMRLVPCLSEEYKERLKMPKYLGMVCVALVMRRRLSPYYLTNVAQDVPFTGVVEMSNLVDAEKNLGGYSLVYLPKYTAPSDSSFEASDEEIVRRFLLALCRMHPLFNTADIVSKHVFRERYVQPVPTLHYPQNAPTVQAGIPHVYVANTTQIVNDTLNNNAMVRIAQNASAVITRDLALRQSAGRYSVGLSLQHVGGV